MDSRTRRRLNVSMCVFSIACRYYPDENMNAKARNQIGNGFILCVYIHFSLLNLSASETSLGKTTQRGKYLNSLLVYENINFHIMKPRMTEVGLGFQGSSLITGRKTQWDSWPSVQQHLHSVYVACYVFR